MNTLQNPDTLKARRNQNENHSKKNVRHFKTAPPSTLPKFSFGKQHSFSVQLNDEL